ncbi:hypothetical protein ES703_111817 [subsurface metagenome]
MSKKVAQKIKTGSSISRFTYGWIVCGVLNYTKQPDNPRPGRIWAAKHNTSVSRLVGEMLEQRMIEENGYEVAMKQYLSQEPKVLKKSWRYPSRDEIHERNLLRCG